MSNQNNELESLSRLREIIIGEQLARLEEEIKTLSNNSNANIEKLSEHFNNLLKDKEENFNTLLNKQREEILEQLKKIEESKADRLTIAETLWNLADAIDPENKDN